MEKKKKEKKKTEFSFSASTSRTECFGMVFLFFFFLLCCFHNLAAGSFIIFNSIVNSQFKIHMHIQYPQCALMKLIKIRCSSLLSLFVWFYRFFFSNLNTKSLFEGSEWNKKIFSKLEILLFFSADSFCFSLNNYFHLVRS